MAGSTNNIAGIEGFDASLPGGWTGTQNLSNHWGNVHSNGDGSITVTSSGGQDAGALQQGGGSGYGLYSFTLSNTPGDVPGAYALLWPADNKWPGAEIDTVEILANGQEYSTVHWNNNGKDAYAAKDLPNVKTSDVHTYSTAWLPGSITNYVDGVQANQFTDHVPADAAHGGTNSLAGVGEQTWWSMDLQHGDNSVHLQNVQYAPPDTPLV
ncbi:family 16 glycosylhydrolase [Paracraurococcus lichenis]|uniref:Family 16 glycosylhydrolase n=1 Tax=Paracraurococcus lichenis TaxID=3064888 RepID=A0ABT9DTJ8_9PROT|nr:family 16 glycosylhydrolase [Paracraurococcus sp. LOR1-02]MDO9707221.1 family 16 glycosylhydrolase [Paracraurococcus sp. LOR1-02]